ncbi:very long chain fatty acid elongase 4-like [Halichondria panicea]|uniref:very long chain fatty acid elongase 4-like n=1 Tax=Halichondria panicea TaxID=6063 RepID=UPI00312B8C0F
MERLEQLKTSFQKSIDNGDARVDDWLFVYSPWPTVALCSAYLLVCFVGPKIMAGREPFQLKPLIMLYNLCMVAYSLYVTVELFLTSKALGFNYICDPLHYNTDSISMRLAAAIWLFYFSKLIEFLDTAFFILRKKSNQVTFLHVYHHVTMPLIWWIAVKWYAGGMSFFTPMLNSFVHTVMYFYYFLSAFGPAMNKYLWWKRYLTMLQLVQFLIGLSAGIYNIVTGCDFDQRVIWSSIVYLISHIFLFSNFYMHSYVKRNGGKGSKRHENGANFLKKDS